MVRSRGRSAPSTGICPAQDRGWRATSPLLVCYAPVGDPECPTDLLAIYAENGVDVVEVGIPTPDPYLDGPAVAASMRRVLANAGRASPILSSLKSQVATRRARCRVVLMGYPDMPFRHYTELAQSGAIHGLLMINAIRHPEPVDLAQWLSETGIARICFVDASLSREAVDRARLAGGYVMLQSHDGRTGIRKALDLSNRAKIGRLRHAGIDVPIVLGFGIGTPEQAAAAVSLGADGVVVGSACIEAAQRGEKSLQNLIASFRAVMDETARYELRKTAFGKGQ